ncbi:hypothetical protein Scep_025785 [Stephania cephalantha]|uniref:Uncharacterized protein n=1 Tax=Stephania cephalantha TaxID=152367 RepID=A0AAP0EIW9_9MAGN
MKATQGESTSGKFQDMSKVFYVKGRSRYKDGGSGQPPDPDDLDEVMQDEMYTSTEDEKSENEKRRETSIWMSTSPRYVFFSFLVWLIMMTPFPMWNRQGVASRGFFHQLSFLLSIHRIKVLILMKTRVTRVVKIKPNEADQTTRTQHRTLAQTMKKSQCSSNAEHTEHREEFRHENHSFINL